MGIDAQVEGDFMITGKTLRWTAKAQRAARKLGLGETQQQICRLRGELEALSLQPENGMLRYTAAMTLQRTREAYAEEKNELDGRIERDSEPSGQKTVVYLKQERIAGADAQLAITMLGMKRMEKQEALMDATTGGKILKIAGVIGCELAAIGTVVSLWKQWLDGTLTSSEAVGVGAGTLIAYTIVAGIFGKSLRKNRCYATLDTFQKIIMPRACREIERALNEVRSAFGAGAAPAGRSEPSRPAADQSMN